MKMRAGIVACALAAACTLQNAASGPPPKTLRDVLTRDEILRSTGTELDLYQTIRSLRPQFLEPPRGVQSRASTASRATAVYIEHIRQAGLEALRSLPSSAVEEVRYLDPTASQNEFGPSASGGALLIKLYKPKDPEFPPL